MDVERLVGDAREREPQAMSATERRFAGVTALAFLGGAIAALALLPPVRAADPLCIVGLVVLLAVASRVQFEIGPAFATAEQLVFVPMLFLCPLDWVPLLVAGAYLLARVPDIALKHVHRDRCIHSFGDASHALGPVLVIGLLAPGPPVLEHGLVYCAAFAAQVACNFLPVAVGDRLLYGIAPLEAARTYGWGYRIDALLSPIAYMTASAAIHTNLALTVIGVAPLVWLFRSFSLERKERYAAAIELNQAYRGTVMVLSDVVEAEDNYTADHCRSVVELCTAVAEELGLDLKTRQELEIAALLHDVGKIAIPNEILNKPAKLTDAEFELMKTHTIEGQALLDRVGGRLARVGEIVRSCHERWDGRGYPDGLRGEEIPVAARIVFCCDAWSAMTTDRPYRKAMSRDEALEELHGNSGTQFEPRVVAALTKVILRDARQPDEYADAVRAMLAAQPLPVKGVEVSA